MASLLRSLILTLACAAVLLSPVVLGHPDQRREDEIEEWLSRFPAGAGSLELVYRNARNDLAIGCLTPGAAFFRVDDEAASPPCPPDFVHDPNTYLINTKQDSSCGLDHNRVFDCPSRGVVNWPISLSDPGKRSLISIEGISGWKKGIPNKDHWSPLVLDEEGPFLVYWRPLPRPKKRLVPGAGNQNKEKKVTSIPLEDERQDSRTACAFLDVGCQFGKLQRNQVPPQQEQRNQGQSGQGRRNQGQPQKEVVRGAGSQAKGNKVQKRDPQSGGRNSVKKCAWLDVACRMGYQGNQGGGQREQVNQVPPQQVQRNQVPPQQVQRYQRQRQEESGEHPGSFIPKFIAPGTSS
ncbi:MAG: hypothetical protein M1823_005186 [Watsoniomyces obsoletus]|nr:MAG: hypothetical protein M1823_005186 [Watsoniomyces obsoletus]